MHPDGVGRDEAGRVGPQDSPWEPFLPLSESPLVSSDVLISPPSVELLFSSEDLTTVLEVVVFVIRELRAEQRKPRQTERPGLTANCWGFRLGTLASGRTENDFRTGISGGGTSLLVDHALS